MTRPDQETLFDHAQRGAQLRDAGMQLAVQAQDGKCPEWSELAYAAIVRIAERQEEVHVDDLRREFRLKPDHPNAFGWPWQRAVRDGVLVHSGRMRPSADPKKHRHQYPVYFSNLFSVKERA
jgi:hypothetical protein